MHKLVICSFSLKFLPSARIMGNAVHSPSSIGVPITRIALDWIQKRHGVLLKLMQTDFSRKMIGPIVFLVGLDGNNQEIKNLYRNIF